MKTVIELLAVLCWLGGLVLFIIAFTSPAGYSLATASAPQVTQVYSQASYYALLAIGAFMSGVFLMGSVRNAE